MSYQCYKYGLQFAKYVLGFAVQCLLLLFTCAKTKINYYNAFLLINILQLLWMYYTNAANMDYGLLDMY